MTFAVDAPLNPNKQTRALCRCEISNIPGGIYIIEIEAPSVNEHLSVNRRQRHFNIQAIYDANVDCLASQQFPGGAHDASFIFGRIMQDGEWLRLVGGMVTCREDNGYPRRLCP